MSEFSTKAPGVYLKEVSGVRPISGVGTAMPAFVGLAPSGPFEPTFIANWSQYDELYGGLVDGMSLGQSVFAYVANGGSACLVVRVAAGGEDVASAASATLQTASGDDALVLTAKQPGTAGNDVSIEVTDAAPAGGGGAGGTEDTDSGTDAGAEGDGGDTDPATAETTLPTTTPAAAPSEEASTFDLTVRAGDQVEEYQGLTAQSMAGQLKRSKLLAVTAGGSGGRPAAGSTTLSGGAAGAELSAAAFLGEEKKLTGLAGVAVVDEVTMLAAPDLMTSLATGAMSAVDVRAVQTAMIDQCEALGDRMAILDPPLFGPDPGQETTPLTPQDALAWLDQMPASKFAAAYYPGVTILDSVTGTQAVLPPSGFVAGAWARNDAEKGVGSAPTGRLRHAIGLSRQVVDAEQGPMNARGLNCLRVFRGSGPVIWGARTLSDDSEWRYLNVRRLFNYIEESVMEGTKFAVFEPNDTDLHARLSRSVTAFLLGLWRDGALVGATPAQAFYVKCDAETNPSDLVDQGIVTIEIGAAPVKPAEFVVIRVRQTNDAATVSA